MRSQMWLERATISELQAGMEEGRITARELAEAYLDRIERLNRKGPEIRAVIETNPDALEIAAKLDRERAAGRVRGPLHGIPILLKDNIDTADRMETTAGSFALVGHPPKKDACVAAKLREAGAVILGKANLSEWAYFRASPGTSGWSARGGQCKNPYSLERSPGGSSSGSGAAVAANMAAAALGTETDGSILCPSSVNGVVGIKPTVGLTSRTGVIPISHSQDTVGPMTKTVSDAALVLGAIAGVDLEDPATEPAKGKTHTDYTRFLDPEGLKGARIGVSRQGHFGYSRHADRIGEKAIKAMEALGAEVVDPANIPTSEELRDSDCELQVLLYEFKAGIERYLKEYRPGAPVQSLGDLIAFNEAHAGEEMPYFGQEIFEMAQAKGSLTDDAYRKALEESRRLAGRDGIDAVMDEYDLDALVMPSFSPAWTIDLVNGDHILGGSSKEAAMAGYPAITVPAGFAHGLPVGITFVGRAFSEPTLIRLAYAYERATGHRKPPEFRPTTP